MVSGEQLHQYRPDAIDSPDAAHNGMNTYRSIQRTNDGRGTMIWTLCIRMDMLAGTKDDESPGYTRKPSLTSAQLLLLLLINRRHLVLGNT